VQAARTTRFDVLVSDLALPDGTGWALLRQLRADRADLPAVAVSGHGEAADVDASLAAGYCAHLMKPVDLRQLRKAIAKCVELRR
jgi:CheY-like chemotaxis protein